MTIISFPAWNRKHLTRGILAAACLAPALAFAQSATPPAASPEQAAQAQAFGQIIVDTFQRGNGLQVCAADGVSVQTIGDTTLRYLRVTTPSGKVSNEMVQGALYTLYPCPFGPFRKELAPAKAAEVSGVWVFPNASQKFRFPPRSTAKLPTAPNPVACDAIAFYDRGELRTAVVGGTAPCPFVKALDMDSSRQTARVMSWSFSTDGRMSVNRSDISNHVEEWDVLVVKQSFEQYGVRFAAGDLLMYLRRTAQNTANLSQEFRHLQRLN